MPQFSIYILQFLTAFVFLFATNLNAQVISFNEHKDSIVIEEKVLYYKGIPYSGTLENYASNGILIGKIEFVNGKMDGLSIEYYESGALKATELYIEGKKHGILTRYYENGKVHIVETFDYNDITERNEYYENGQLERIETFDEDGGYKVLEYNTNGFLLGESFMNKFGNGYHRVYLLKYPSERQYPDPRGTWLEYEVVKGEIQYSY